MTDEELKQVAQRLHATSYWTHDELLTAVQDRRELYAEVDRLRAENRKLVEACKAALVSSNTYDSLALALRAAIEGK